MSVLNDEEQPFRQKNNKNNNNNNDGNLSQMNKQEKAPNVTISDTTTTTTNNNKRSEINEQDQLLHSGSSNNNDSNNNTVIDEALSPSILAAYRQLAQERSIHDYKLEAQPIAGIGENAYGLIMQVQLIPTSPTSLPSFHSVLKISPKSDARRQHMRVVDFYEREVFMYGKVLQSFQNLKQAIPAKSTTTPAAFNIVPGMYHSSLNTKDEFIIFEDLAQSHYVQNARTQMPTFDLVNVSIKALAQLHAMSFVLQAQQPHIFANYVRNMRDNLFDDIEQVSIEFAKNYICRTRDMLYEDGAEHSVGRRRIKSKVLAQVAKHFKEICLRCVNGKANAPYAVICHGDFWNNNIMYKYDETNRPTKAKLIDFQMSRYAPPVLDLVHYLFACTEKDLRDAHFGTFMSNYYDTLMQHISLYDLSSAELYPRQIFESQLRDFGIYGFCMSAFAIPFFISNTNELLDLDEVSEAIQQSGLSSSSDNSDNDELQSETNCDSCSVGDVVDNLDEIRKCRQLVESYDMLTARTIPIFKRRMLGIVADLVKYNMTDNILKL